MGFEWDGWVCMGRATNVFMFTARVAWKKMVAGEGGH